MKVMNEEKLTKMANFINHYIEENNGEAPKFKEILDYMGMSNSVGYRYLTTLRDRGVVEYQGKSTLSVKGKSAMKSLFKRLPIYGMIPCGSPEDYRQEVQGYVAIPREWVEGECYLLRTTGNSMIDVGINDGDLVLVKAVESAVDGQVIVALTEEGTTLKRYREDETGRPWLYAENRAYSHNNRFLYPKQIVVQGRALKVIKDL